MVLLGILSLALAAALGQTNVFYMPKEAEEMPGISAADPFFGATNDEQVYAAAEFAHVPADIITITEVAFRVYRESHVPLDVVIERLLLRLEIFKGTMAELVAKQTGLKNPTIVFDRSNVRLVGRMGDSAAFDIRFSLKSPFTYDRRMGHLVLNIISNGSFGSKTSMDALGGDWSFSRGAYINVEPGGRRSITPKIMAAKFSYKVLSAQIDAIQRFPTEVRLACALSGAPDFIQVESSATVAGAFQSEANVRYDRISPERLLATIPASSASRYFRIQLR